MHPDISNTLGVELPRYAALRAAVEAQIAAFQLVLQSHEAGQNPMGFWVSVTRYGETKSLLRTTIFKFGKST